MTMILGHDSPPVKQHFPLSFVFHRKPICKDNSRRGLCRKVGLLWRFLTLMVLAMGVVCMFFSNTARPSIDQLIKHGVEIFTSHCPEINRPDMHYPQPTTFDRKECRCTPVHYFAIVSMQRSGSGWFETLLNSHKNVRSHGEVFSVASRRKNITTIRNTLDTLYNLDWVSKYHKKDCTAAVGLKWMLNQGFMEYKSEVLAYLKENSISIIFLFRRNILERYISLIANKFDEQAKLINGTHRAHVHSTEEANLLASYKPCINLTLLVPSLKSMEDSMIDAHQSFNSVRNMVVYYEDLIERKEELIRVQEFLHVRPRQLKSKHVKIHTQPLADRVENWAELSKVLNGTEYRSFLVH